MSGFGYGFCIGAIFVIVLRRWHDKPRRGIMVLPPPPKDFTPPELKGVVEVPPEALGNATTRSAQSEATPKGMG